MGMFYRTKNGSTTITHNNNNKNNNMNMKNKTSTSSSLQSSSYRRRRPPSSSSFRIAEKRQRWMIHGSILVGVLLLVGLYSMLVHWVLSSSSFSTSSSSFPTHAKQSRQSRPQVMQQQEQEQKQSSKQQARQTETNHDRAFTTKTTTTTTSTTTLSSSSSSSSTSTKRTISLSPSVLFNHTLIRQFVQDYGISAWHKPIVAYLEAPMQDVVPGTGSRGTLDHNPKTGRRGGKHDVGTPPQFITPLPLRTQTPQELEHVIYDNIQSCHDVPAKWPIDAGLQLDPKTGEAIVTNVRGDQEQQQQQRDNNNTSSSWYRQSLPYCPVDMDPFLPWIHDIFPSIDGHVIHVIAQNKRRCHTGRYDTEQVNRLTPQVALMQPISVQRITLEMAQQLAPELWNPTSSSSLSNHNNTTTTTTTSTIPLSRYRLISRSQIPTNNDGHNYTRFICRFTTRHPIHVNHSIIVGETLSSYEFNYEYASYRKGEKTLLTPKGKDSKLFWTSNLHFTCPVPTKSIYNLPYRIAHGEMVLQNDKDNDNNDKNHLSLPLLYLDLIPIRTSVRYQQHYLGEELIGPNTKQSKWHISGLDPQKAWGEHGHVLPDIQASGRWTNLPICTPPKLITDDYPHGIYWTLSSSSNDDKDKKDDDDDDDDDHNEESTTPNNVVKQGQGQISAQQEQQQVAVQPPKTTPRGMKNKNKTKQKPHFLSACLWASSEFKTRGTKHGPITDTAQRLVEWLEFHLLVGFDHFYIYDNSGAHSNTTSLHFVLEQQQPAFIGKVTYIYWPSQICNNNIPAADSTGERSSQYAAESSCRTRFAPFTEWIISFDTDEYLVPMGSHTSLKTVLQEAHPQQEEEQEEEQQDKHYHMNNKTKILSFRSSRGYLRHDKSYPIQNGRERLPNATFLEAYNCDSAGSPKPEWAERARKQVYIADYVLYHYVHYSTVTMGYIQDTYQHHVGTTGTGTTSTGTTSSSDSYRPYFRERPPTERPANELTEAVMVHTKTIKFDQSTCIYLFLLKKNKIPVVFVFLF